MAKETNPHTSHTVFVGKVRESCQGCLHCSSSRAALIRELWNISIPSWGQKFCLVLAWLLTDVTFSGLLAFSCGGVEDEVQGKAGQAVPNLCPHLFLAPEVPPYSGRVKLEDEVAQAFEQLHLGQAGAGSGPPRPASI